MVKNSKEWEKQEKLDTKGNRNWKERDEKMERKGGEKRKVIEEEDAKECDTQ